MSVTQLCHLWSIRPCFVWMKYLCVCGLTVWVTVAAELFGWMLCFLWAIWPRPKQITSSSADCETATASQMRAQSYKDCEIHRQLSSFRNCASEFVIHGWMSVEKPGPAPTSSRCIITAAEWICFILSQASSPGFNQPKAKWCEGGKHEKKLKICILHHPFISWHASNILKVYSWLLVKECQCMTQHF